MNAAANANITAAFDRLSSAGLTRISTFSDAAGRLFLSGIIGDTWVTFRARAAGLTLHSVDGDNSLAIALRAVVNG